jgi:putative ABC transport system permease protein
MALHMQNFQAYYIFIKINSMDISSTIAHIKAVYEGNNPHHPFDYSFLDEAFDRTYQTEKKLSDAFLVFSALAIFISALGLFGLASFTTEEKTKEIGLRKVLGASVADIVSYLSREFTKWVAVANIFAWPIAYIAMNKWLQNFAYRTNLNIWIFILSGLAALIIALLTVSYQTIKAAAANPVDSLRYE